MSGHGHTMRLSPYLVLGLPSTASKEEVKEAFRKLCMQYHPDKVIGSDKVSAEARFRVIKSAYDEILKGQAGYAPPPPGTSPSASYARAYYKAHHGGLEPEGPLRCGGPYGGFMTEGDFYRHLFRNVRNNPVVLTAAGLLAIPMVAAVVNIANGNTEFIDKFKNEGIFMFTDQMRFKVNGRNTVRSNPYSIRNDGEDRLEESYIYKSDKYKHLRPALAQAYKTGGNEGSASGAGSATADAAPAAAAAAL